MQVNSITIHEWFNRHWHGRSGKILKIVLPWEIRQRATGAVAMGNLTHPNETSTIEKATAYYQEILSSLPHGCDFKPRMTCYLTDAISPEEVVRGFEEDVWCAVKLYMANQQGQGGTTGSQHGVKNLLGRYPVFVAMEKKGIPLLGHFEAVEEDVDEFDREIVSLERDLKPLLKAFPGLPVVFEHITDGRAADFVAEANYNIQATATPHHLARNRNAMFWGGMNPVEYCKPVFKRESHRLRVRKYVTSGNRRFGAGDDSAPWVEEAKSRCCGCAAGIFHTNSVEEYATVFDEDNALKHLGPFLSENFVGLYGMEVSSKKMTIERKPLLIPEKIGTVRVFKGGTYLSWKLVG